MANIMALIPSIHALMTSVSVRMRWPRVSAKATTHPARDPQRRVAKGSASPKTSLSVASGPAAARPVA